MLEKDAQGNAEFFAYVVGANSNGIPQKTKVTAAFVLADVLNGNRQDNKGSVYQDAQGNYKFFSQELTEKDKEKYKPYGVGSGFQPLLPAAGSNVQAAPKMGGTFSKFAVVPLIPLLA